MRRRLRREDGVRNPFADDHQTDDAPAEEEPPTGYESLLHADFGPDHNATGSPKPRSKAQRQRDERARAAAEKRRLLEITEARAAPQRWVGAAHARAKAEKAARFGRARSSTREQVSKLTSVTYSMPFSQPVILCSLHTKDGEGVDRSSSSALSGPVFLPSTTWTCVSSSFALGHTCLTCR